MALVLNHIKNHIKEYLLLYITLFFMTGVMGSRPYISLISNEFGASIFQIGIVVSLFNILPFFLAIKIGQWVDGIGNKIPMVLGTFIGSLAIMIPFFYADLMGVIVSQLIAGLALTTYAIGGQSYAGNIATDKMSRERNITRFMIGGGIGNFVGPMVGGYSADILGYQWAFFILGSISLLSIMLVIFVPLVKKPKESDEPYRFLSTLKLLKNKYIRRVILMSVIVVTSREVYVAYFPLIAQDRGISDANIGLMISFYALSGILVRFSLPILIQRFGKNLILFLTILSTGLIFLVIPLSSSMVMLFALSFVLGIGFGVGMPISISTNIELLPRDRVGEGLGLRLTMQRLTTFSSPIALGALTGLVGLSGIFYVCGVLILLFITKSKVEK